MGSLLQLDSDVSRGERRQERLQDLVTELSTEFINLSADEIDRAITEALRRVAEFVVIDRAYVFLIDQDAMRMSNTHEWCRDGVASMIQNLQDVPVGAYAWSMSRILKGDILYIPRVAELPDEQPDKDLLQAEGIQSLLAVPITSRERVIGLIGLDAVFAEHRWREETIALLKIVGAVFGNAIERMRADQVLLRERDFIANVIETAPSLILVLTPDGRCTRANRAFRDLTGLSTADLYETGWQKVIPEESREAARQALRTTMGGVPAQLEGALLSKDGDRRIILWFGAVIRSADGRPEYVVITGSDLTETSVLREQVEQSRRLDSLGRVAATIAHEFNNVLLSISPYAEVISRFSDQPVDVRHAAERIARAVKRGERITRQVTRFANPVEPHLQEIVASEWTESLVEEMRPVINQRSRAPVVIETQITRARHSVLGDPLQLHQVFSNLLLNAADALPRGGTITVAVEEIENHERLPVSDSPSPLWAHWRVSDTGTGISPAVLERVFEPLFTTKKHGTGLGLAVSHQIVKSHGGAMSVETSLGRGTTFHVFLPAALRDQQCLVH